MADVSWATRPHPVKPGCHLILLTASLPDGSTFTDEQTGQDGDERFNETIRSRMLMSLSHAGAQVRKRLASQAAPPDPVPAPEPTPDPPQEAGFSLPEELILELPAEPVVEPAPVAEPEPHPFADLIDATPLDLNEVPDVLKRFVEADETASEFRIRLKSLWQRFGIEDGKHFPGGGEALSGEEKILMGDLMGVMNAHLFAWMKPNE